MVVAARDRRLRVWYTKNKESSRLNRNQKKQRRKDRYKCRCSECGVYQALSAFRWTIEERVDVCRTCELVQSVRSMCCDDSFSVNDICIHFGSASGRAENCVGIATATHTIRLKRRNGLHETFTFLVGCIDKLSRSQPDGKSTRICQEVHTCQD